jgi:hypothetical protein
VRAVERLLLAMSDATEKAREVLPTRLVVRESCGGGTVAAPNAASAEARRIGGIHNPEEVVKT